MNPERVSTVEAGPVRTVLVRVAPGEDLFEALSEVCARYGIESGYIASMIGSLKTADVVCVTEDPENPERSVYLEPYRMEGRIELVTASGIIGQEDGRLSLHLHGVVAGSDMKPLAGHLADRGETKVLSTVEAVIGVFSGAKFLRSFDEETGFVLFRPFPSGPGGDRPRE
ncbi:MAG: PPC domain-containing DNA-binding protein [Aminivibrio sp.]|jgi:predicted DNA-binding protein with PD1-like motif